MITFKLFLNEKLKKQSDADIDTTDYLKHTGKINKKFGYDKIHDHPDIKAKKIGTFNIQHYLKPHTNNSVLANRYLDQLYNNDNPQVDETDIDEKNNRVEGLTKHIKNLSKLFTPDNTNKKPIITYSGIPTRIGEKLLNSKKNSKHTFGRFVSVSTAFRTAYNFGIDHRKNNKDVHILKSYSTPGSLLSIAKYSPYPSENELITNHGAHVIYHYTTKNDTHDKEDTDYINNYYKKPDKEIYIHHVTILPTNTPLEKY